MLVCRKFTQILSVGYLFETINFGRKEYIRSIHEKHRDTAIDKAKSVPRYGKKCKRLLVDTGINSTSIIADLAATFPNLSFFHISRDFIYISLDEYTQVDPFEGWKNNLETLNVSSGSMIFPKSILNQGVFNRLSAINVKVNLRYPTRLVTCDIFAALCNTPVLTSLRIGYYSMDITNLEMLHSNAPQLTSLTIEGGVFSGPVNLQLFNINQLRRWKY
jgi:hypothetical protein